MTDKPDAFGLHHDRIHKDPGRARPAKTPPTLATALIKTWGFQKHILIGRDESEMLESDEAKILTAWLDLHSIPYAWVPNLTTSAANAAKQKALGMQPGFPDYIIFYAPGRVAFFELKRAKGKPRPEQVEWMQRISELGHPVAHGTAAGAIDWLQELSRKNACQ